jgi:hypothetical protein
MSLTDAWDRPVTVSNGLFHYRNRAIDVLVINEIRTKGKRVLINHYKRNDGLPTAIIVCKDADAAVALYDYILEQTHPDPVEPDTTHPLTLWSFLGCGRC